jgi:hypothetical protein
VAVLNGDVDRGLEPDAHSAVSQAPEEFKGRVSALWAESAMKKRTLSLDLPITFTEFWKIAGVKKSLAQNWTNGRSLHVLPSALCGVGKGNHRVFTIADAMLVAMFAALRDVGASHRALRGLLRSCEALPEMMVKHFSSSNGWLLIWSFDGKAFWSKSMNISEKAPLPLPADGVAVQFIVDLTHLRQGIENRAGDVGIKC